MFRVAKALCALPGTRHEDVITRMIESGCFICVTPEFARERFSIQWLGGKEDYNCFMNLPELIIVETEAPFGYVLYNGRRTIQAGEVVTEYTGETVTEFRSQQDFAYVVDANTPNGEFRKIDAAKQGNAARFASHLPDTQTVQQYKFIDPRPPIATANTELGIVRDVGRAFLEAVRKIAPFEQIGFDYGNTYPWIERDPELFDLMGNVIPRETYIPQERILSIMATNRNDHGRPLVAHMPINQLFMGGNVQIEGGNVVINATANGVPQRWIIERAIFEQAVNGPRYRPFIYGTVEEPTYDQPLQTMDTNALQHLQAMTADTMLRRIIRTVNADMCNP